MAVQDVSAADARGAAVLAARGLTRSYRMGEVEVHALRGVDLDLFDGEFVVILGPSGSGKSTLLNLLGGLDIPSAGTLAYRGKTMDWSDAALTAYRRDQVGFVFQFYNLIPSLTARENVLLVTEISKSPMPAELALELVGLGDRLDHFPSQMSGGEQQRVAIARAIAKRPDLLLCDEPTGALDIKTGRVVLEVLDRIHRELRTTTAIITHNSAIAAMADRVLTIGDGLVVHVDHNARRVGAAELAW
ncbi:MAG TPA: ABC transporter ATP-binding protein [Polyangiaceae bacterium]|nr:ABC transporter ATP-binding protein [Polyangiaceae bacterium]